MQPTRKTPAVFWMPSISLSSWLSARSSTPVELPELPRFRASESISSMKIADGRDRRALSKSLRMVASVSPTYLGT